MKNTIFTLAKASLALGLCSAIALSPVMAQAQGSTGVGVEQIRAKVKRRIAVLNFDVATVSKSGLSYGLYSDTGAGQGISNLLTNELVKDGTYILIERSQIDKVLSEQNLGQSGRIEPSTAAQIGRVLGVDAVLIGSITEFNVTDSSQSGSLGGFFGLGGNRKKQNANVNLTARVVSTATGQILTSAEGKGVADKSTGGGTILGIGGGTQADNTDQLLSAASNQAVENLVKELVAISSKLDSLPAIAPVEEMVVADISGGEVTLNKGGAHGFRPGMIVSVERVIKDIKDPSTGAVIRRQTQKLGQVQLTEVQPDFSVGKTITGSGFRVGDVAKAID